MLFPRYFRTLLHDLSTGDEPLITSQLSAETEGGECVYSVSDFRHLERTSGNDDTPVSGLWRWKCRTDEGLTSVPLSAGRC